MREKTMIWDQQAPLSERPTLLTSDERPGNPTDALKWDREEECKA